MFMDTFEAFKNRISVREYSDKPVEKEKLEKMVDAGHLAPTARGEEPWEFVVVTGREKLKELAEITDHGKFMAGASASIVIFCKDTKYYLEDGCAATENMLLAATALGIASCWIAGDKKEYGAKIVEALSAPAGFKLVSIVSLGYPKSKPEPHSKKPVSQVIHWERFYPHIT
jgi:nitroreductase